MGVAENSGHAMTFKSLEDDSRKIVCRSKILPGHDLLASNLHIDPTTMSAIVKSRQDAFAYDDTVSTVPSVITDDDNYQAESCMTKIETSEIVGRFFLISVSKHSMMCRS